VQGVVNILVCQYLSRDETSPETGLITRFLKKKTSDEKIFPLPFPAERCAWQIPVHITMALLYGIAGVQILNIYSCP
jgi:hypothetical protein